jgi:hypothetical protein
MHLGKIYMDCFLTIPVSRPAKYSSMTITFLFNITKIKGNNLHMRLTHHDTSIEKGNKDSANPWRGRPQGLSKAGEPLKLSFSLGNEGSMVRHKRKAG